LNPFFLLEDDPTPARSDQVTRAASLVVSALSFVRAVRREELAPDKVKNTPLDMYQYARMFGTARIPTEHGCHIAQDPDSKHIVVMSHGQFYWFDVLDDNSDLIMNEKDLAVNLQAVISDASEMPIQDAAKGALGILSTENRKVWSGLRDLLKRDEGSNNHECLNIVDSALFILCLDYTEPTTTSDLCMNMLCGTSRVERGLQVGTCMNRWYDKLQLIVCKNGSAGINFEHTGVDGHTVLRFASDVYTDTILRFAKSINGLAPSLWATDSPDPAKRDPASFGDVHTTPYKLEWTLEPEIVTALRFAETRLADLIGQNEFATLEFSSYGKNFITSMGCSPDAYVQLAFQAAYYGLYGRTECVYEPAMTKAFFHGRTEAIRSVTDQSVHFIKTFWGDNPPAEKVKALKKACEKHVAITRDAAKGQGQDRHLYALYCIWQRSIDEAYNTNGTGSSSEGATSPRDPSSPSEEDGLSSPSSMGQVHVLHSMPSLFADSGWEKLNTTILSTSNCGNPSLRHFGFGPTSGDGFGIGYIIKDGSISICASSKHRQTNRFVESLEAYFLEMRRLLRAVKAAQNAGKLTVSANVSKARQAEDQTTISKLKRTGTNILERRDSSKPTDDSDDFDDEDGLGGCKYVHTLFSLLTFIDGFFDAGMLSSLLKSSIHEDHDEKSSRQKQIGRRLRLAEY
jgi:carnitine O-acetyltransferase